MITFGETIVLAAALSVDSMAVSLSGSVSMGQLRWGKVTRVALALAAIQTFLLLAGYYAGGALSLLITRYGKWLGFALLIYVGGGMIVEGIRGENETRDFSSAWKIIVAAVATSIDAFACGASFGLTGVSVAELWQIALATFIATILFAVAGMFCGSAIGRRFGRPAIIVAGIVLIVIGVRLVV